MTSSDNEPIQIYPILKAIVPCPHCATATEIYVRGFYTYQCDGCGEKFRCSCHREFDEWKARRLWGEDVDETDATPREEMVLEQKVSAEVDKRVLKSISLKTSDGETSDIPIDLP